MKHIFRFPILHASASNPPINPIWGLFCYSVCFAPIWYTILFLAKAKDCGRWEEKAERLAWHLLCFLSYYCNLAVGSRVERLQLQLQLLRKIPTERHRAQDGIPPALWHFVFI